MWIRMKWFPVWVEHGWINFAKFMSHLKIPGIRMYTYSMFHIEDPQIWGATVQNLVDRATWHVGVLHPWRSRPCGICTFTNRRGNMNADWFFFTNEVRRPIAYKTASVGMIRLRFWCWCSLLLHLTGVHLDKASVAQMATDAPLPWRTRKVSYPYVLPQFLTLNQWT